MRIDIHEVEDGGFRISCHGMDEFLGGFWEYECSNGWTLSSIANPAVNVENRILYIWGLVKVANHEVLCCSPQVFNEIREAVAEFNGDGVFLSLEDNFFEEDI